MTEKEVKEGTEELVVLFERLREKLQVEKRQNDLKQQQADLADPEIWKERERAEQLAKAVGESHKLLEEFVEAEDLVGKLKAGVTAEAFFAARKKVRELEVKTMFTGKYDRANAILSIHAGAGGQDAADWAGILKNMFLGYAEKAGFKTMIIDESLDDFQSKTGSKPIKNTTIEIRGGYAYGYLRGEAGVHRLVRISPFSAKQLRHTSFALVEVLPEFKELADEEDIKIPEEDLRVDTFRSSGPGGQNVNKVETAVRITHLPTGVTVASQVERSQSQNREKAMTLLKSKLHKLMEEAQVEELGKLKTKEKAEWGSQIRSYVLHPYKLVKDHRTGVETNQVDEILEGNLDEFIEAEIIAERK